MIKRDFENLEKNGVFQFFGSAVSPPITMSASRFINSKPEMSFMYNFQSNPRLARASRLTA